MDETLSTDLTPAPAPETSTQLDTGTPVDPALAAHKEEGKKPESRIDAIKRAATDLGVKADDDTAKPEKEQKADEKAEPEADDKNAQVKPEAKSEPKPNEGKEGEDYPNVPAKFLPAAKEKWRNTPLPVQQEVGRLVREHEAEISKIRESHERYESVRQFDEIARQNGRELKDSLTKMVEIETSLQQNPIAGLNRILMEVGPRKADGQPFSLYDIAMHIAQQGPQGYQQMMQMPAQQRQQNQVDPRISQLEQQLRAMQQEQLASRIIDPFKNSHPRYDELEEDIAFFLDSGKIPTSLSAPERLAAAYDMAERINPPSRVQAQSFEDRPDSQSESRADVSLSGTKSVKGAPASGVDVSSRRRGKMSRSEAINAAMSELGLN
jgi:hypothetical protein